jgi:putative ABC transport system permease protein
VIQLFGLFALRYIRREPVKSLVSVLAVALGAAVYLAIGAAVDSSIAAFSDTVESLAGKAQLQVVASSGTGFPAASYGDVAHLPGVAAATPVIEAIAQPAGELGEALLILGVDFFTDAKFRTYGLTVGGDRHHFLDEPDSLAVTQALATKFGLRLGSRLPVVVSGRKKDLVVRTILRPEGPGRALAGNFAVMDFGAAQMLLGKEGRLDRIDLLLQPGESVEAARARLSHLLPAGLELQRPRERGADVDKMIGAYRMNLRALSLVAFFVGMFLVYSAVSLSAVRRRREVGIMRSLGATRGQVLALFLSEGAALGLVGGLVGLLLGILLARMALASVSKTVSSIYLLVDAQRLHISWSSVVATLALSVLVALAASLPPALEAASVVPREALHGQHLERRLAGRLGLLALAGALLLVLAGFLAMQPPAYGHPVAGFAAAFVTLLAFALLTPVCVAAAGRLLSPVARLAGCEGYLGARYLRMSLSRTGVALAALSCALAMLISVQEMTQSFRATVEGWVGESVGGDLFITPAFLPSARFEAYLPPEVDAYARTLPEVAAVYRQRDVRLIQKPGHAVVVRAGDAAVLAGHSSVRFKQGDPGVLRNLGERVVISEVLATLSGLSVGDSLTLPTPKGPRAFRIAGVIYDYHAEGGMALMDMATFRRYWDGDNRLNGIRLFLRDRGRLEDVRRTLLSRFSSHYALFIISAAELKARVLSIFDQTFAITRALQIIALAVAAMGVMSTFGMLIVERQRDLAVLRAVGASRLQLVRMTLSEAWLGSLVSYVLGAVSGTCLSLLLIFVINRQSFGWTISYHFLPWVYIEAAALVLLTSLAAALLPAVSAARVRVLEALKVE